MKILRKFAGVGGSVALTVLAAANVAAHAQGILTVTPARTVSTSAGNGTQGYTGDGGAATSSTLALPAAVAYDAAGDLFLADANNHVIREIVKSTGNIITVAGTGVAGFGGDGGAATSAFLDTPTGIAVDGSGTLYIADSHNNRIRMVTGGTIATIAGTGAAGFGGDAAAATAALLNKPSAVAIDAGGNVYIADTNNQRIREITGTTISTIAGTGEQNFTGDSGAATSATLDLPTGVAVDASGNVYIADRHNQRIREITAGMISTLAGSGTPNFAGGFSGDGASATAATLAKPTGVSVDANGNVYVTDSNNQRVRQLGGGVIATVVGTGDQGFAGDGGAATGAVLNGPRATAPDASGNLSIAGGPNQRVRAALLPTLTFASQTVGVTGAGQAVTLSNTGTAAITVSSISYAGAFTTTAGGTCPTAPITLAAGASCTVNVASMPAAVGVSAGSVVFSGTGVVSQTILLAGTGAVASTKTSVASNLANPLVGQAVTLTATVTPIGAGTPMGTVTFYAGATPLGSAALSGGTASLPTTFLVGGVYSITAVYGGNASFSGSTSPAIAQAVDDFAIVPTVAYADAAPGSVATYNLSIVPQNAAFVYPIMFTALGLPPGVMATFTPASVTPGASTPSVVMTLQIPATHALQRLEGFSGGTLALALLVLPLSGRIRRRGRSLPPLVMFGAGILALGGLAGLTGCGTGSGFFGQSQQGYIITVVGTATGTNGAILQRTTQVALTVQ